MRRATLRIEPTLQPSEVNYFHHLISQHISCLISPGISSSDFPQDFHRLISLEMLSSEFSQSFTV